MDAIHVDLFQGACNLDAPRAEPRVSAWRRAIGEVFAASLQ
jgi:hypothetical protein